MPMQWTFEYFSFQTISSFGKSIELSLILICLPPMLDGRGENVLITLTLSISGPCDIIFHCKIVNPKVGACFNPRHFK